MTTMNQSNTAILLKDKKKNNTPLVDRQSKPAYETLPKRVIDEYRCALLKPKVQQS
jgi:hypothetical protein